MVWSTRSVQNPKNPAKPNKPKNPSLGFTVLVDREVDPLRLFAEVDWKNNTARYTMYKARSVPEMGK